MIETRNLRELGKILGILIAEEGSYTYVDKLAYAPSKDLVTFYLREALRDLHSLMRKTRFENEKTPNELKSINFEIIENCIQKLRDVEDRRELRELTSIIASMALTYSASLIQESEKSKGEK
ncbi:MAG: type I-A CRISPR-associated protein Csa5 [Candidatus Verstraetearchaeota archaeon]|nr:type I-A CRISPR-associated protein Csa5 [Candidatus Verstraetearchaeota archaeon]